MNCWSKINIPVELYVEIQGFLTEVEYFQLLKTSAFFSAIGFSTRIFSLSQGLTKRFLNDNSFRELISSKVQSVNRQLVLSINGDLLTDRFLSFSNLEDCKLLFSGAKFRFSTHNSVVQFPSIDRVQKLSLLVLPELLSIKSFPNLSELTLGSCSSLEDVSCFLSLKVLFLFYCHKLKMSLL
jgi:hypothetical protein